MKKHLLAFMMMFGGLLINAQNIYSGQNIEQNRKYWASNNRYYLIFQNDGNLVMYNRGGGSVWDSKTTNKGVKAVFQEDGNLVVYSPGNQVAFTSNTYGKRADRLTIQDDGNLVIYNRSTPLWASQGNIKNDNNSRGGDYVNTGHRFRRDVKLYSSDRNYYLMFQDDGNLVLSNRNGSPIWTTGTGNRGARAEFQNDGNLVVYDSYNKAIWISNTYNKGANKLMVQNDGNLVIYGNNYPIWDSKTQR